MITVTRRDLEPGPQAVQSAHALAEYSFARPEEWARWHESNYLVMLTVADERELERLADELLQAEADPCIFREPDLNDSLTALCCLDGPASRRLTRALPMLGAPPPPRSSVGRAADSSSAGRRFDPCRGDDQNRRS